MKRFQDEQELILTRIDSLFHEIASRCIGSDNILSLCKFVPMLYRLGMPCLVPIQKNYIEKCDSIADHLADLWIINGDMKWRTLHDGMRAVIELTSDIDKLEQDNDLLKQKYCDIITEWRLSVSDGKIWNDISECEALSRIDIMCRDSNKLSDYSYDDLIGDVYNSYRQIVSIETASPEMLHLLLDIEDAIDQPGIDDAVISKIQNNVTASLKRYVPETEEYWNLISILTESICVEQTNCL